MHRLFIIAASLVLFASPASLAHAQDAPDMNTVAMLSWKCDYGAMEELVQKAKELWIPAAQELQDEGKLAYAQVLTHAWGDEWNLIFYFRAADMAAYLEAWESWITRVDEAEPSGADWFFERCKEHKDGFYTSVAQTEVP
jgi:hypothetical protein